MIIVLVVSVLSSVTALNKPVLTSAVGRQAFDESLSSLQSAPTTDNISGVAYCLVSPDKTIIKALLSKQLIS